MRTIRKPSEELAIDLLKKSLESRYDSVKEDRTYTDRPDAVFIVDGKRIAVECRIVTPERIMEFHGITLQADALYQAFMPSEPHIWVRNAVSAKSPYAEVYKKRSDASEAWLVLHIGSTYGPKVGDLAPNWQLIGFAYGVYTATNTFERVYIVDEYEKGVICLFRSERGYCVGKIEEIDYPGERLPVDIRFFGKVRIKLLPSGKKGVSVNLNQPYERLCLQPLDSFILSRLLGSRDTFLCECRTRIPISDSLCVQKNIATYCTVGVKKKRLTRASTRNNFRCTSNRS